MPGDELTIHGENPTVAYLGPLSSYSHQAALECFEQDGFSFKPQSTIADIFTAVQSRACVYGVVPFENSTNGSVVFTLDLFCDRSNTFSDIQVCDEAYLDVHHSILATSPSLGSIERIYSHPQAFGQCEKWLNSHLKEVERVDVSSTSKAAQLAAQQPGTAAIASKIAAEVHHLQTLASNIEDTPDNTTRFFIISAVERSKVSEEEGDRDKSLLSFTIDHSSAGALCDTLEVFKQYGLNLTSISSRPSRVKPWNYVFFVEFMGHKDEDKVREAVEELRKHCLELRVLGSWRDRQRDFQLIRTKKS